MEDVHKLLKIPESECPDIWIRLPRHKWPKSCMVQYGRPSRFSCKEFVRSIFMGKATGLGKSFELGTLICQWKETEHLSWTDMWKHISDSAKSTARTGHLKTKK